MNENPPPQFTNWDNMPGEPNEIWKDIIYYEVRNVLCNIWMKMIVRDNGLMNPTERWNLQYTRGLPDKNALVPLTITSTIDEVQNGYMNTWSEDDAKESSIFKRDNARLLNLLERIHRAVCFYPQQDRDVKDFLNEYKEAGEVPLVPLVIVELIVEYMGSQQIDGPIRQHGRSSCICRLNRSTASAEDKNNRIEQIRDLVCNTWGDELQEILEIKARLPDEFGWWEGKNYVVGDGPFKHTTEGESVSIEDLSIPTRDFKHD